MADAEEGARRVVREWNGEGRVGYVTRFELDAAWCDAHVCADAKDGAERWIATEAVPELNAHLKGPIRVVATLRPPPATRSRG